MFLNVLTQNEKETFLLLAHQIAKSNGILDEKEQKMLEEYRNEMDITTKVQLEDTQDVKNLIKNFESDKSKRIAFLEGLAVAFADGIYHEEQKQLIEELKNDFNITEEDYQNFKSWIVKSNYMYEQAEKLIEV
ncbi:hypothetical protein SAMN05421781_1363 [Marinococcus luteus]|uniref:Tellurite resistance protein TerB n=1 Tax=Marinococcus luteus TaxID=1122204 RepID=A0A1H2TEF7_9BACI|nr:hypothetical protein [Marinococcus luteus]SDW42262.1 hypothetical protein SAMN05421781_1363 [Marinococcus luteus]